MRTGTLQEIWDDLQSGPKTAEERILGHLRKHYQSADLLPDFAIDDVKRSTNRRGVGPFTYESFGPPSWFQSGYLILRVEVSGRLTEFITHPGEELLLNVGDASINYEFYTPKISGLQWPVERNAVVNTGDCIRINPALLHRNEILGSSSTIAWMVIRPETPPSSIVVHADPGLSSTTASSEDSAKKELVPPKHTFTEIDLNRWFDKDDPAYGPAKFLLLVSGVLERLRVRRVAGALTAVQLSKLCGFTNIFGKFYPARVERLELDNFSIDRLMRMSGQLDVDLLAIAKAFNWTFRIERQLVSAMANKQMSISPLERVPVPHQIHPAILRLEQGQPWSIDLDRATGQIASIIVLRGEVAARIGGSTLKSISTGHVFHSRSEKLELQAFVDSDALLIRCGGACTCCAAPKAE